MKANLRTKLLSCTISPNWWRPTLWSGGHTLETDPTQHGWQARRPGDNHEFVLVGRKGLPGCFTARQMHCGDVDVAIYMDETPEQVLEVWKTGESTSCFDPLYRQLPQIPGWGLQVLEILREYQRQAREG